MHYDATVRKRIKSEQKAIIIANFKHILGMKLLFLLPFLLIGTLDVLWSWQQLEPLLSGDFVGTIPTGSNLTWILQLVIGAPLVLGMMTFYITLMREEHASISLLFHPFTSLRTFGRSIRMLLMLWLRSFLWTLLPSILLTASLIPAVISYSYTAGAPSFAFLAQCVVSLFLFLIVMALISVRLATYQAGYVRLHDNEFIGCWDAQREAAQAFSGHYGDLLLFFLSFVPWYLAQIVVCGIMLSPVLLVGVNLSTTSIIVAVLSGIALCIVMLLFSTFINAYQTMSFLRLFEHLAPAPEQPINFAPFAEQDSFEQNPFWRVPEAPAPSEQPEEPTQPETPPTPDEPNDGSKSDSK
ncbi:MAG: DUF975 family protein [Clostridia bacterium]|nr:DUF975 family protein [Clostridia bacterium]